MITSVSLHVISRNFGCILSSLLAVTTLLYHYPLTAFISFIMTGGLVTTDDNDRLRKGNTHLKTFPSVIVFRTWPFIDKLLSAEKTQMHLK